MMNLNSKLKKIRDILTPLNVNCYHYIAVDKKEDYIVWEEEGEDTSLELDNYKIEQSITGKIDFFTKTEYNSIVDDIQNALRINSISFRLNSVQFEEQTSFIHYEWEFLI